jgi:signal transduction histidine kinase
LRSPGEIDLSGTPRVRVEWLVASARVLLALGCLLAVLVDPLELPAQVFVLYLLAWYLAYGLGMLALVWAPVKFAPGWALAVHAFDLASFTLLVATTRAATSPFFMCFVFLLMCGALRWNVRGALWTAAGTLAIYAAISLYGSLVLAVPGFELNTFLIRAVSLTIITAMLASLSAHQVRFQGEISRIVEWPRKLPRSPLEVASESLSHASSLLGDATLVVAWATDEAGDLNVGCLHDGEFNLVEGDTSDFDPLVAPGLAGKSFQTADAADDRGVVVIHTSGGFRRRECRPINEALRARFDIRAVQSWPLDGELIRGRMFCVNRPRMGIDDLVVGEIVARQVASRLDSALMLERLRGAAALEERVRVASDLHDSLLQAQAGAALHLLAARRMLERQPDAARQGLEEVQSLLERGELEMRSFIRGLRPSTAASHEPAEVSLDDRIAALAGRIERQWTVAVNVTLNGPIDRIPAALHDDVYRLAQEAVLNAARHAEASTISLSLAIRGRDLEMEVSDNGRGFPFHGTFDLSALNEMQAGPITLRERVTRLSGSLWLLSRDTGSIVRMVIPLPTLVTSD